MPNNNDVLAHLELFEKWYAYKHLKREKACNESISHVLKKSDIPVQILKPTLEKFVKNVELRWKPCCRNRGKFLSKNENLLNLSIKLDQNRDNTAGLSMQGRAKKPFEELCNRSQQIKFKELVSTTSTEEHSILVDQPRPAYGSTNTGNTARVFFRNAEKAADITGVDKKIIYRFYVILQTISSGYEIDTEEFKKYTTETAELYVKLYSRYHMPISVHKMLIHGAQIISHAIFPIGQLGEEAQEAKNKDFKFAREHRTRKDSACHTNEDIFNFLPLSSDPMISQISLKKNHDNNKLKIEPDAINLLKCPSIFNKSAITEVDSSSDSE